MPRWSSYTCCFRRCSSRAHQAAVQRDTEAALELLDSRIAECIKKESEKEKALMQAQHSLRCMAANLASDPYPEVLMHRLKAEVMEKNAAQRELDKASALIQHLKTQRRVLQESELSSEVVFTLKRVMDRVQPHVKKTVSLTDQVVDLVLDQREEVADVTEALTKDLEEAFENEPDDVYLPAPPTTSLEEEADVESQMLMQAIVADKEMMTV